VQNKCEVPTVTVMMLSSVAMCQVSKWLPGASGAVTLSGAGRADNSTTLAADTATQGPFIGITHGVFYIYINL